MDNQKNLLLAVIFSIVVLVVFDFFFNPQKNIEELNQENISESSEALDSDLPTITKSIDRPKIGKEIKQDRLTFSAKRIEGSVNLYGATLDDLILKDYFQTIKREKNVRVLEQEKKS